MPEISMALNISTPTVLSIVNELEKRQMIEVNGEFESTGGRKARVLASVRNFRYAVGLDVTRNHVGITYTNLSGCALARKRVRKPFSYSQDYFEAIARLTEEFVEECEIPPEKITGMGISVPAIINVRDQVITNSHALGVYGVSCTEWIEKMPYPCELVNDANAAAVAEISGRSIPGNMVYFSLSNTVGGAALFRDDLGRIKFWSPWQGDTFSLYEGDNWRSCEFGHMVIHPGGERCYCGKEGCVDAYCSALKLADRTEGNLERFFQEMEAGNEELQAVWEEYLKNLLVAVDNLRMCFDCRVVLGGYVGSYIAPYINKIRKIAAEKNIFEKDGSYINACRYQKEASALGAAILQIERHIDTI